MLGTTSTERAAWVWVAAMGARSSMIASVSSDWSTSCMDITARIASRPVLPDL
jgi:hypothetical protein